MRKENEDETQKGVEREWRGEGMEKRKGEVREGRKQRKGRIRDKREERK